MFVCVCVPAHHQGLGQDVFNEFEIIALELLALGAGSLHFLVRIETEELGLVFELTLLQDYGEKHTQHVIREPLQKAIMRQIAMGHISRHSLFSLKVTEKRCYVVLMKGQKRHLALALTIYFCLTINNPKCVVFTLA